MGWARPSFQFASLASVVCASMSRTASTVSADGTSEARAGVPDAKATPVADIFRNARRDESIVAFDILKPGLPHFVVSNANEGDWLNAAKQKCYQISGGTKSGRLATADHGAGNGAALGFTDP
jgi:hypothetical protein